MGRRYVQLLAAASIAAALVVVLLFMAEPVDRRIRPAEICVINIRMIGNGLQQYAKDHGGMFPQDLQVLVKDQILPSEYLLCNHAQTKRAGSARPKQPAVLAVDYVYIASGLNQSTVTPQTVLLYEPLTNHEDDALSGSGSAVYYADGRSEWVPQERALLLLQDPRSVVRPRAEVGVTSRTGSD